MDVIALIPDWVKVLLGAGGLVTLITAILVFIATRKRDRSSDLSSRWDDASELSARMREAIEKEVERQVAPIREELKNVKIESHEMHQAVRTRETQLWLWDQRGRQGHLPKLPAPILHRLGLGALVDDAAFASPQTEGEISP